MIQYIVQSVHDVPMANKGAPITLLRLVTEFPQEALSAARGILKDSDNNVGPIKSVTVHALTPGLTYSSEEARSTCAAPAQTLRYVGLKTCGGDTKETLFGRFEGIL